jgi:hypothetical protein
LSEGESMLWPLLLQLGLILTNAVFACAEIAIISINDNKLAKLTATGDKRAKRLPAFWLQYRLVLRWPAFLPAPLQLIIFRTGWQTGW